MVGYNVKMPDYRDCVDLKMSPSHWQYLTPEFEEVKKCYEDVEVNLKKCLTHYESLYNFKMDYMEAINFVRYNPGQHFAVHADHGFSYTCTLSSVMYLNDDYEGGELWFPYLNINFKPQAGDIVLFPSTYIYAHSSLKVKSGVKYSAVTMFDYNDNNHKHGIGYGGDGSKITENVGISKADNVPLTYPMPQ
jgi:Rps23 Pro-64 3,4-dihydroxylase Tpa1-like proline 4-hydroxylase